MAEILGKDLDKWDDSLAARQPFALKESDVSGPQYLTGSDFVRSAKISPEWKLPVNNQIPKVAQPIITMGEAVVDTVVNYVPNLKNVAAQRAIELTTGEEMPETVAGRLTKGTEIGRLQDDVARVLGLGMIGADALTNRKEYAEKAKTYDEAVELVNNRDYPLTKYARRVLAETTNQVETRRVVRELYNQSRGIDSSAWYNQAGSIIGAMIPTIVVSRGVGATARAFGASRIGATNAALNATKGIVATQMAGDYAEETAAEYLERTGDTTFENFTAKDATGLSAMAYGAIAGQIEVLGGIEPIMAGAVSKVGLRSGLLKAGAKVGLQEAAEEFLQGMAEFFTRKIDRSTEKTWGEAFKEALTGAVWGLFIGGPMGTGAFYVNRRNLTKGIKKALPNISDTQATQVADAMIDNMAETSSQDPTLRNNLREKVALMYRDIDLDNKDDRIDAMTDLEYSLIAMDAIDRGIDIADHELFQGVVNELGWFRAGIPEAEREKIESINNNIRELRTQLEELNKAKEKDWEKIEEIENKLAQASQYVLEKVSDLATEFEKLERKYVAKEKKKAGIPTDTVETTDKKYTDAEILGMFAKAKNDGSIKLDNWENVRWSSLLSAGDTYQKGKRNKPATEAEKAKFARKMLDKYMPGWNTVLKDGTYRFDTKNVYYQPSVYDGLTTTDSVMSVINTLRGLKDGSTERMLYDKRNKNWYLMNADDATHIDIFVKAFEQGNYPEFKNQREAEQFFQENYLADDQTLLQFLAQKYDNPVDTKQAMEHTLGTDEYTNAYLRDNIVIYTRYDSDFAESGLPVESFDHYKATYDENNNRTITLEEKAKTTYRDMPINPRDRIPKVRGGWTKDKILRYLKEFGTHASPTKAVREIANFDTFEDFMNNVFYHGSRYGTSGRMRPSITMSDREVERIGGGGYGEKYWAISITKSKKVAGNFATSMSGGNIYPVLLAKNAKVIEMPELTDSADLDDHIVDLYEKGIDAVWIGDKNAGEQELAVINPRALINIGTSEYYGAYKLGSEENPIRLNTEEDFRKIYEFAKNYKYMDENTRADEAKGIVRWQNRVSGGAPATYRGAYIPEYRFILRANKMDASTLSHEMAHDWMEVNFARYRSGKQGKDFMKAWGALEKALGIPEDATSVPRKASETFARAYEAWIVQNEDWSKLIAVEDKDKDAVEKLMKDYQGELRDIYNDISNPYFKQTWGRLGELKPELKAWFDRVVNITDLDTMVERGEMTESQAANEKLNRAIDTVIENTTDSDTKQALTEAKTLNDTSRYEVEGGNKNSIQRRLSNLAKEIDENNMVLKGEKYDTRRDMMQVAEAADNFVKTRLDDALAIINGEMAETEGLYKEDLYTALERLAVENGDLNLIDELKNSEVANRLAKELGQRVAGFRNIKQSTDIDVVSALKSLDMKFNKALDNKKAKQEYDAALKLLDESMKQQDKIADKELDNFLDELKCK